MAELELVAAEAPQKLTEYFTLESRTGNELPFTDGSVVLSEKTAELLGLSAGDTFWVQGTNGSYVELTLTGVAKNYLGAYLYVTQKTLDRLVADPAWNTVYVSTCMAQTECHTVSVSKQFVLRELMRYEIFWLNYMNIVSNRAQTLHAKLWAGFPDGMEARVRHFLLSHMERLSGEKMLKIKMETLARILNETRLNVSRTLNSMQERGLVELRRGEVLVPEAAYLLPDGL